jgi:hypothetical protein
MMDDIQKHNNYINIASSQTYTSYLYSLVYMDVKLGLYPKAEVPKIYTLPPPPQSKHLINFMPPFQKDCKQILI